MSNINNIVSSFELQDKLNPKIWSLSKNDKYEMKPEVRSHLIEIAHDFIESLNVDVIVSDIIMTGSLANFNWSKYSDVDLHIIVDYSQFPKNSTELYNELFRMKKTIYSLKHNITIFGYDVELYVEDENIPRDVKNVGRYSILMDDWVTYPTKENVKINYDSIKEKVKQWMKIIDGVIENIEDEDIDTAKKLIEKYRTKLRKYRECGLEKGGEYSDENLVFKILRRNGYLEKIKNLKNKLTDKRFTLKESLRNGSSVGNFKIISDNTRQGHGGRKLGNWQSDNAWDLKAPIGTPIYSFTNGTVIKANPSKSGNPKIFGIQLSIKGEGNNPDIFYTHLDSVNLKSGDKVKIGDYLGKITKWPSHPEGSHVHIGLPYGRDLGDLIKDNQIDVNNFGREPRRQSSTTTTFTLLNPVSSTNYTSGFGMRWGKKHSGIDIGVKSGTNVVAPADGTVIDAKTKENACGGTLFIDHGNGIKTRYCHLKQIKVKEGDKVRKGDIVGLSGGDKNDVGRGNSKGAHLHFEVYENDRTVDPKPYLDGSKKITKTQDIGIDTDSDEEKIDIFSDNEIFSQEDLINMFKGTFGSFFKQ